jgi:hypothetical protein
VPKAFKVKLAPLALPVRKARKVLKAPPARLAPKALPVKVRWFIWNMPTLADTRWARRT